MPDSIVTPLEALRKLSPARAALVEVLHWARAAEAEARTTAFEIEATKPGNVPRHEGRAEAYADAVRELEGNDQSIGWAKRSPARSTWRNRSSGKGI